jgi:CHAD domain-containing protein
VQVVEEQEDKFEVDADWAPPPIADLVPDGGRLDQDVRRLENTYFDTAGAGLRLFGVTLRRRVGGSETGWQLKVPNGTARTELQSGSRAKRLPAPLADGVSGLRAGERLDQVATMVTTRTAYRVLDAADELVLEIADDQVEFGLPDGESMLHSWREVEVELGPAGKQKDLKRARKLLIAAGATPSTIRTKLDRALGPISPDDEGSVVQQGKTTSNTVGDLVTAYLAAQCDVLASNDVGLRTGAPVVHKTRVAARRLRSTLRVFGDVFGGQPAQELNNEVAWYADLLGEVRDREVLNARLTQQIADLPPERVRGPVEAEVTKTLAAERDDAIQRLSRGMRSRRYQHLLKLLRGWKSAPPLTNAADETDTTAAAYVKKAKQKANKRLRSADGDIERLHRARKATKRLRYAAELVEPVDGNMKRVAKKAENLQTLLGEHQDAVVSANFLANLSSSRNGESGDGGFTYGILMADELHRAAAIRQSLKKSSQFPGPDVLPLGERRMFFGLLLERALQAPTPQLRFAAHGEGRHRHRVASAKAAAIPPMPMRMFQLPSASMNGM